MLKQILSISAIAAGLFVFSSCEHQPPIRIAVTPVDTTGNGGGGSGKCNPDTVYFNEILPIIVSNCGGAGCHDAATKADGVQLTDYSTIMSTGKVEPFKPGESKIYKEMNKGTMPPTGRLSQDVIDKINKWIAQGAKNNYCSSVCDSTKFTYSADISKIMTVNCVSCHQSGGTAQNLLLGNHADLKVYALNGRLMGALKHQSGYLPMPNSTNFLSDCELKKIQKWIDNGAPNN